MLYTVNFDRESIGFLRIGFFLSVLFVVLFYLVILFWLIVLLLLILRVLFDLNGLFGLLLGFGLYKLANCRLDASIKCHFVSRFHGADPRFCCLSNIASSVRMTAIRSSIFANALTM